jgi:Sel1 repeat
VIGVIEADANDRRPATARTRVRIRLMWYRSAADQDDALAQDNLGIMYRDGRGVQQDFAEAVKWWRKAADQGNASAQYSLGARFYEGHGVRQDFAEAAKWWRKAAEQGYGNAQENLTALYARFPALRGKPDIVTPAAPNPGRTPIQSAQQTRADSAEAEHPRIHVGSGPAKEIPDWTHPICARSGVPGCFEESDLETMMALMRDGQFNAASKVAGCLVLPAGERATVLKRDGWIDVYFKVAITAAGSSPMIVWASAYGFQNADDPGPFKPTIQQAEQK